MQKAEENGSDDAIVAAIHAKYSTVKLLLDYGAACVAVNEDGKSARDLAEDNEHQHIIRTFETYKPVPKKKKKKGKGGEVIICEELKTAWQSSLDNKLTHGMLTSLLVPKYIDSVVALLMAHNIISTAVRNEVATLQNMCWLHGNRDYCTENEYLPVSKLALSNVDKLIFHNILAHAEGVGYIRGGHAFVIKIASNIQEDVRRLGDEMHAEIETITRAMMRLEQRTLLVEGRVSQLESRTKPLEAWSKEASAKVNELCKGNQAIINDIHNLSSSFTIRCSYTRI